MPSVTSRSSFALVTAFTLVVATAPVASDATLASTPRSGEYVVRIPADVEVLRRTLATEIDDEATALELAQVVHSESRAVGMDPLFTLAIMKVESGFRANAVSRRGAVGLLQLRPIAARAVARIEPERADAVSARHLRDPRTNVALGLRYLRQLEREFPDRQTALAAYNMGPTRVRQRLAARLRVPDGYARRVRAAYTQFTAAASAGETAMRSSSRGLVERCATPSAATDGLPAALVPHAFATFG